MGDNCYYKGLFYLPVSIRTVISKNRTVYLTISYVGTILAEMNWEERPEEIDVLVNRADILDLLTDEHIRKPDLVETSKYSRSTIDRAMRDLEEAGYVTRSTDGYVATQSGQFAIEGYRTFLREQRAVLAAEDVLGTIPPEYDLPLELVTGSRVETDDPGHQLFEHLATALADADEIRLHLPELVDSRQLRLCHTHVVGDTLDVTLQAPQRVLADMANEFPYLWNDLTGTAAFAARDAEPVPFGLALVLEEGSVRSVSLFPIEGGDVTAFLHAEATAVADWARSCFESLGGDTDDVSGTISPGTAGAALTRFADERLPAPIRTQGFVRVDDDYFHRRKPLDPATAWRAGLGLPEVAAGYAVERTPGDVDADSLADHLRQRLLAGAHVALVGPQGSGKSTVCKSVIRRWYDGNDGTVLYRESGRGQPFEATTLLQTVIDETPGHVLIVVEDAVRPEANAIFEVIAACRGRDDVSFLLDAREQEWHDPEEFPMDARLRALRQEAIETVTVPPLDEQDCVNLVEHSEAIADTAFEVTVTDILDEIQASAEDDRTATPGVMTLLFRRLARRIDPRNGADRATTLDENVDQVRADLRELGETALDVGVLVNTLNAAGLRVSPAYVSALVANEDTYDGIDRALDRLMGVVLYPASEPTDTAYRTVHESWSVRFLERLLAETDDAERRFGRCLSAFLALADDADLRDEVARTTADDDALESIRIDPVEWADETVASLFALGRTYPKLAHLFGTTDGSTIELPTACSTRTRVDVVESRGRMYTATDDLDRAEAEFNHLETAADELSDAGATRARARSLLGQSEVAKRRGDMETGAGRAREALDIADELDDDVLRAQIRRQLGDIAAGRGEFDEAREEYLTSLSLERVVGDRYGQAETHGTLGDVAMKQGDLETAQDHLERSLEHFREVTDRSGEADSLRTLGAVAMKRNAVSDARQYLRQALDLYRETGDKHGQSSTLTNLGLTCLRVGDLDTARDCFEECLELDREVGNEHGQAQSRNCLGELFQRAGEFGTARDHIEACLDSYREIGDQHGEALAVGSLGTISRKQGDLEAARGYHEESLALKREVGDEQREATSLDNLGVVARQQGDLDTARGYHEEALALQQSSGDSHGEALSLVHLGRVAYESGEYDTAQEHYQQALDVAGEADVDIARARAERHLGLLADERGDPEQATDCFETALSLFEAKGYRYDELRTRADLVEVAVGCDLDEVTDSQYRAVRDRFADADGVLADLRERIERLVENSDAPIPTGS